MTRAYRLERRDVTGIELRVLVFKRFSLLGESIGMPLYWMRHEGRITMISIVMTRPAT
jgi:hypothetical protein